jgi:hypothetical protein
MEKLFIIIALSIICNSLHSQNLIDPPKLFNKNDSANISQTFNQFLLGWNWGCEGRVLDSALNIIFFHDSYLYFSISPLKFK